MSGDGIRHEAFFAVLGNTPENSDRWSALMAALVTLRLVDEWLAAGEADPETLAAVHAAVGAVPVGDPGRKLIGEILAPIAERGPWEFRTVAAPLFAYARWLHDGSQWALADDVYTMVWHGLLDRAHATRADTDLASQAALFAGACRRGAGEADGAEEAYATAQLLSEELGDEVRKRLAQLGQAKVAQMRGNLPAAEDALRQLIEQATGPSLADVRAKAYHDLGVTLFWRDDYNGAIEAHHHAWIGTKAPDEQLRILADIGSTLGELGYVNEARAANLMVRERANDPTLRGAAGINLMELARLERDQAEFMRYGALVAKDLASLPKNIQADYHFGMGLGFETFGDKQRALVQYDRAIEIAEAHRLGHELFRADCARDTLHDGLSNVVEPITPPPLPAVARLGTALERARVGAH
jgi:tetratricopeptide (TPR) repeat protein